MGVDVQAGPIIMAVAWLITGLVFGSLTYGFARLAESGATNREITEWKGAIISGVLIALYCFFLTSWAVARFGYWLCVAWPKVCML